MRSPLTGPHSCATFVVTLERRSRIGRWNNKSSIDGGPMFSEFTLTPARTTENTVKNETVKIAD